MADGRIEIALMVIGLLAPVLAWFVLARWLASGPVELGPALSVGLTGTEFCGICAVLAS